MERINKIIELHQADKKNFIRIFRMYKMLKIVSTPKSAYENIFHNIFAKACVGYTTLK